MELFNNTSIHLILNKYKAYVKFKCLFTQFNFKLYNYKYSILWYSTLDMKESRYRMIFVEIPGRDNLNIKNIVFDYNGTVAEDGIMASQTKENLKKISGKLKVYIITADTYGNVKKQCEGLPVSVETFPKGNATFHKKSFVEKLGSEETMVIGNGMNDIEMFKAAILSIAVIGEEGCAGKLIAQSDIVVRSIEKVFSMIENTNRIVATLRD